MKTILIMAERIGHEDTGKQDEKIVEIARELGDENILHVYARSVVLNEYGDYLRMKGIEIHTQPVTLVVNMPHDYDAIIAFDTWSMKQANLFASDKKIKVGEKTKVFDIFKEIKKK
jgi:hypothetical protein